MKEKSKLFLQNFSKYSPGGVSSNVRAREPIAIAYGKEAMLVDLDGNEYIDYSIGIWPESFRAWIT